MFSSKLLKYFAFAALAFIVLAIVGKKAGWFGGNKPILVATEKVQKRTIYEIITANGKIQPETEVKISSDVSGEIVELFVKEGEAVKAGQLLLKIKPDLYVSAKDRALATVNNSKSNRENSIARLEQSKAQFNKTKLTYNRNKRLVDQQTISQAEWDASVAEFEVAKADVEASEQNVKAAESNVKIAEASLKEANEKLVKTSIFAPLDGIITKLSVERGERVVGTDMMAGTELLRIADLKKMEVKVEVNENDIVRVKSGDTAIIEVDAYLNKKFLGVVTEIANSANSSSQQSADQVTSFEVKIIVLESSYKDLISINKPYPFRPGMTANVDIQTNKKMNVVSVPIEAVTSRTDSAILNKVVNKVGNKPLTQEISKPSEYVFVLNKANAKARKVKTGIQDNNFIEIAEGLKGDEIIIVAPYSAISKKLKDSSLIKVVNKKDIFAEK
jgi:HlyD family secretion protein